MEFFVKQEKKTEIDSFAVESVSLTVTEYYNRLSWSSLLKAITLSPLHTRKSIVQNKEKRI